MIIFLYAEEDFDMQHVLHIVTGAPGSGKSTTLAAFLHLRSPFLAFDMDWLLLPASRVARKDISFESSIWPSYNALWFEILLMIGKNHKRPVLFSPITPQDIEGYDQQPWWTRIEWLVLDCDDSVRRHRLRQRSKWNDMMIEDAIHDAALLRQAMPTRVDTGSDAPEHIALTILSWLKQTSRKREKDVSN